MCKEVQESLSPALMVVSLEYEVLGDFFWSRYVYE